MLAIAGLIFLVVFLALPALQRSQRDTARRQDVAKAVAAIQQYFADGGDATQATFAAAGAKGYSDLGETGSPVDTYLKNAGLSPSSTRESIRVSNGSAWPGINTLELWPTHKCGAKNPGGSLAMTMTPATNYDMAVVVRLEAGNVNGTNLASAAGAVFYCADAGR